MYEPIEEDISLQWLREHKNEYVSFSETGIIYSKEIPFRTGRLADLGFTIVPTMKITPNRSSSSIVIKYKDKQHSIGCIHIAVEVDKTWVKELSNYDQEDADKLVEKKLVSTENNKKLLENIPNFEQFISLLSYADGIADMGGEMILYYDKMTNPPFGFNSFLTNSFLECIKSIDEDTLIEIEKEYILDQMRSLYEESINTGDKSDMVDFIRKNIDRVEQLQFMVEIADLNYMIKYASPSYKLLIEFCENHEYSAYRVIHRTIFLISPHSLRLIANNVNIVNINGILHPCFSVSSIISESTSNNIKNIVFLDSKETTILYRKIQIFLSDVEEESLVDINNGVVEPKYSLRVIKKKLNLNVDKPAYELGIPTSELYDLFSTRRGYFFTCNNPDIHEINLMSIFNSYNDVCSVIIPNIHILNLIVNFFK